MEKQAADRKPADAHLDPSVTSRFDNGNDRDRAYDTGFKYQIPEAQNPQGPNPSPGYQHPSSIGADTNKIAPEPNSTPSRSGADMGERVGSGVRGVFASIHGAGEWLRGGINAAVDRTFGSEDGVAQNEAISRAGQEEIRSGRFSRDAHEGWRK
ncbi:hypothetical protein BDW74DRAFT_182963 [Aspergillus multicolor]|uniref:uncharacterized protein n=1 Tax=Aspergillus multicolor TaxID=41759 RepID=UPI003CCD3EA6